MNRRTPQVSIVESDVVRYSCQTPLHRRVLRAIERDRLIPTGGRVWVAVSAGGDSVALAVILADVALGADWSVAGLFHLNHRLRGAEADADERFCETLATDLELPMQVQRVDVAARARADRTSIETAGHRVRYEWFEGLTAGGTADRVATAHTMDDLAETVLLRITRGAGPTGLAGIRPRAGSVIRPLLDTRRGELRAFLRARGVPHREDATNHDPAVLRNRIRHRVLPVLEAECSPAVVAALARAAAIARADADWIDAAVAAAPPDITQEAGSAAVEIDAAGLAAEPLALARRLARGALERAGSRRIGFDQIERLVQMAGGGGPACADLPGVRVERRGGRLYLAPSADRRRGDRRDRRRGSGEDRAHRFEYPLPVPGEAEIPEVGVRVSAAPAVAPDVLDARSDTVAVREGSINPPLTVRNWRPGDLFRPLGLGGRTKKLHDFFVDRKIARADRGAIPLVVDPRLGVVWVAGHALAEDVRLTASGEGVLVLKVAKLGDMG